MFRKFMSAGIRPSFMPVFVGLLMLMILTVLPASAQQVTPSASTDTITFSSTVGCSSTALNVNVTVPSSTNVMGFKFDILFPSDTFACDTTAVTESSLLTTGAGGAETYVFILDGESLSARPGRLTVIGVRMQSSSSNKGLSNALYGLLSGIKFRKIINDTLFAGRDSTVTNTDSIYITNFVFRDQNNETVNVATATISLRLFLLMLRRGADFNGDGSADGQDLTALLRVMRALDPIGSYLDYGSPGDQGVVYESRTPDNQIQSEDLTLFLRYLRNLEL